MKDDPVMALLAFSLMLNAVLFGTVLGMAFMRWKCSCVCPETDDDEIYGDVVQGAWPPRRWPHTQAPTRTYRSAEGGVGWERPSNKPQPSPPIFS